MKRDRIDVILANDIFKYQNLNPKMRKNQFEGWLFKVYDKFHNHLTKKERKCLVRKSSEQDCLKFTTSVHSRVSNRDSPYIPDRGFPVHFPVGCSFKHSQTLPKSIFGNDCLLNFIDFGNLCTNLENFFRWIYSDCKTPGTKILRRLKYRCMRMNTILDMSVELYR